MWQDMIFSPSADDPCRILIPATIAEELDQFRQVKTLQPESGGLILGLRRGPHIEVLKITTPLVGDFRSRTSFLRRDPGHFELAQHLWRESKGTVGYVGEWHTHPEAQPKPSGVDTNQWRKVLKLERQFAIFIIVGTDNWFVARGCPINFSLQSLCTNLERVTTSN